MAIVMEGHLAVGAWMSSRSPASSTASAVVPPKAAIMVVS